MQCLACNTPCDDEATFCPSCGRPVHTDPAARDELAKFRSAIAAAMSNNLGSAMFVIVETLIDGIVAGPSHASEATHRHAIHDQIVSRLKARGLIR